MRCHASIGALRCALREGHGSVRTAFNGDPFVARLACLEDLPEPPGFVVTHRAINGWTFDAFRDGSTWTLAPSLECDPDELLSVLVT